MLGFASASAEPDAYTISLGKGAHNMALVGHCDDAIELVEKAGAHDAAYGQFVANDPAIQHCFEERRYAGRMRAYQAREREREAADAARMHARQLASIQRARQIQAAYDRVEEARALREPPNQRAGLDVMLFLGPAVGVTGSLRYEVAMGGDGYLLARVGGGAAGAIASEDGGGNGVYTMIANLGFRNYSGRSYFGLDGGLEVLHTELLVHDGDASTPARHWHLLPNVALDFGKKYANSFDCGVGVLLWPFPGVGFHLGGDFMR